MKGNERRLLEEKLRYAVMEEEVELDPNLRLQMLERAKAALMQPSEPSSVQPSRRHGIGRRVLVVSAAAVLIMVLSFGFAVLTPGSVSHARGFVRTAAIWVNNTFHLGYEFEDPVYESSQHAVREDIYHSFDEAASNTTCPIVYFDDPTVELQSIAILNAGAYPSITIDCQKDSALLSISLNHALENTLTGLKRSTLIPWQHGELECWETDLGNHALTYYSGMEISIYGIDIVYDDFLALCQKLKSFN